MVVMVGLYVLLLIGLVEGFDELKPSNVTVTAYSTVSISLSWQAASEDGVWYQIWFWPVNASMDLAMATTIHHSFIIIDLLPGELYNIWLLGIKGNSTSQYVTIQHHTSNNFKIYCIVYIVMQCDISKEP